MWKEFGNKRKRECRKSLSKMEIIDKYLLSCPSGKSDLARPASSTKVFHPQNYFSYFSCPVSFISCRKSRETKHTFSSDNKFTKLNHESLPEAIQPLKEIWLCFRQHCHCGPSSYLCVCVCVSFGRKIKEHSPSSSCSSCSCCSQIINPPDRFSNPESHKAQRRYCSFTAVE